jgi:diguanylate cyclase (GGDEF)-like protein
MLYTWPVLWVSAFYGRRGTAMILVWTGLCHGIALWSMAPGVGSTDRWIDVMSSGTVLAVVVRVLWERNERLVARRTAEARIDPLTGLANRRGLEERLDVEVPRANRDGGRMAVVVFDIDHFKRVNDQHGHDAGDRVLAWLGTVLREQVRGVDIASRLGGEEFALVLPGGDAAAGARLADRVRAVVAEGCDGLMLTVSAGVAAATAPLDPVALLHRADAALYAAKRGGRDRVVLASSLAPAAAAV